MPALRLLKRAGLREPLIAVLPDRFEHSVSVFTAKAGLHVYERLIGQLGEDIHHLPIRKARTTRRGAYRLRIRVRADALRSLQREPAHEDGKPAHQQALLLCEQFVAPIDQRLQRLVARQHAATASGQQSEPIAQARRNLLHGEGFNPRRRELDGEGYAVQAAADRRSPR